MASRGTWWARLGSVLGAVALAVFVPVAAWASSGPGELVAEAARRRRGIGTALSGLCCLGVIVLVVLLVFVLMRRRSGPRR